MTCASTGGGTCPRSLTCPTGASGTITCGCQIVKGLGANKAKILAAGASQPTADQSLVQYMLASAMVETNTMDPTSYPLGDGKVGDSFNAGVAKQNWGMMRMCHAAWNGMNGNACNPASACPAAQMNQSTALDVQVYIECRNMFGTRWWGGHRDGSAGLSNPNTPDIENFKAGEDWTDQMIQTGGHQCDDVRFSVNLPAIIE
jgi:hypothetical protein